MKKAIAGKEYLCIETVIMDSGKTQYIQGKKYKSENDGCITNEENNPDHVWTKKGMKTFFRLACGIETKPEYMITKDQIKGVYELGGVVTQSWLKEWFPDAFKEDKFELVVGKWYKNNACDKLFCFNGEFDNDNDPKGYGFVNLNTWMKSNSIGWGGEFKEATTEEVTEALTKEILRKYKIGDYVISVHSKCVYKLETLEITGEINHLKLDGVCVLKDGVFANIQTITKEDAEKELGKKIID